MDYFHVDIDDCVLEDCSGYGVCVDGVDSFTCVCKSGYTGTLCQTSKLNLNNFSLKL